MSDIKTTENYFFSFLLIFCPENQFVILVRKPRENYKIVFSIFYVWYVESKLFFFFIWDSYFLGFRKFKKWYWLCRNWAVNPEIVLFEPFSVRKIFSMLQKTMQWATWCFLQFFLHFWLWAYSFLSEPGCWTLKSWVFWVNEKRSLSEPKKLKISVWSIQVNWENCKGTSKNKRKTEENSGGCSLHCFPAA